MTGVIFSRIFNWNKENDVRIKIVAGIAVLVGTGFAMFGARPTQIILFHQQQVVSSFHSSHYYL